MAFLLTHNVASRDTITMNTLGLCITMIHKADTHAQRSGWQRVSLDKTVGNIFVMWVKK